MTKKYRQHVIAELLAAHAISSQQELSELLAGEGILATQATLSRDLEELGAMKIRVGGSPHPVYAIAGLPKEQPAPEEALRRVLREWVVEQAISGNLVLLQTPPGCAHVVASAIDRAGVRGVLGTVAGDDTLLVIVAEEIGGRAVGTELERLREVGE